MRVALVSEHANPLAALGGEDAGGQNVHVAELAGQLVARGNEVTVFTRRDNTAVPTRVDAPHGYTVEHVPAGPPSDIPKDQLLPYMAAFGEYLADRWAGDRFDVVHAHFWRSGLAAAEAARRVDLPVLQTFHALGTVKKRQQGSRDTSPPERIGIERRLCGTVDHVIATCSDEVRELRKMGLPAHRVSVIPCGVDVTSFRPRPVERPPHPRLLVIGRLVERKGVGNVIEALVHLPGVELLVAGGPPADALDVDPQVCRLRALAESQGVADRVTFLGSVDRPDVPELMCSADVVVAVPWYEPFGIVPVEAMACGRPVVGSSVGGLLDTVVPGATGELVPPRRPDLLAPVLRDLLNDPQRREAYGRAGRERAVATYPWPEVAARTEEVYAAVRQGQLRSTGAAR
jgi:glycosyltransferase involved in cell wall biosynthesis